MLDIRRIIPWAGVAVGAVLTFRVACPPPAEAQASAPTRPHVFLVVWDAARADHFPFHGYPRDTTPVLASVAAKSAVFEQAHASGSWTLPSVASLITGQFGYNHGVDWDPENWGVDVSDASRTLAEVLKDAGYATAWYTSQSMFEPKTGYYRGIDDHALVWGSEIVNRTAHFIDSAQGRPVFVILYWLDPHAPYDPHEKFDLWSQPGAPKVNIEEKKDRQTQGYHSHADINSGRVKLTPAQWQALVDRYDGELRWNDDRFNQFWSMLERKRLQDRSVVVLTADHGEAFDDRPEQRTWHGRPYEENQHVPLVVSAPWRIPPKRVPSVVRGVDVFPTVLDLAGVPVPQGINGASLLPLIDGPAADRPSIGGTHMYDSVVYYRSGPWKLLLERTGARRSQLFDLSKDPGERTDLSGKPDFARIHAEMDDFIRRTTFAVDRSHQKTIDAKELERLRALGYTD
ncbi:MAG: sulfatase [Deltaproteobacteria bacterium]|nr:sulfatase [Deltaproteobacteria bacterium]